MESRLSEELLSDDTIVLDTNIEDTSSLSENLMETKPESPLVFKAHLARLANVVTRVPKVIEA